MISPPTSRDTTSPSESELASPGADLLYLSY